MEQVLAVDGGGTKCEALLMTKDGEALAFHVVHPGRDGTAYRMGRGRDPSAAMDALQGVARKINPDATLHVVGVHAATAFANPNINLKVDRVILWRANEADAAFAAVGETYGVVALAGTGAFAHLRMPKLVRHVDGLGPLIGDWGGAHQIGREGLRAAIRSNISYRINTALFEAIVHHMGHKLTDPFLWSHIIEEGITIMADRTAVARFSKVVDEVARQGDAVALKILETAADDLADTVEHMVDAAGVANEPLPLVGTGSVIQKSDLYWNRLCKGVSEFMPNMRPVRQFLPQSGGVALLALAQAVEKGMIDADVEKARMRLIETLPALIKQNESKKGTI
jgi:glucosamine kinase